MSRLKKKREPKPKADKHTKHPLALREISDNLTITSDAVTAWFLLPPQRWAFRSDRQRQDLIDSVARALSRLVGHRVYIRVTSRPYPVAVWAENLDHNTEAPLPGWDDHLVSVQRRLQTATLADKEVYIGIRVWGRNKFDRAASKVMRGTSTKERTRLEAKVARVAEIVSVAGLDAHAATTADMEWLMHRSVALGLPAPAALSAASAENWDADDLHTFTDPVRVHRARFSPVTKITAQRGRSTITRYVAVLTMGRMDPIKIAEPGGIDPWMQHSDRLGFPVEWCSTFDVIDGTTAKAQVNKSLLTVRDMQLSYRKHDLDEPLTLARQAERARQIEDDMTVGDSVSATRATGWHRIAVAGATEEECLNRVRAVQDSFSHLHMDVVHPNHQYDLLREFIPGEPLATTAYKRHMPMRYLAAGLPQVTSNVGDRRGPYLGYTCGSSRRAFMHDPWYATEVAETSGLVPIVGGLGAGKSVLLGLSAYESARRGIQTTILDPSGPLSRLTELPEFDGTALHLDLLNARPGTLNPYSVIARPTRKQFPDDKSFADAEENAAAERKMLAHDVARMLLPPQVDAMSQTAIVLADAIRANGATWNHTMHGVVKCLKEHENPHGKVIADYLNDMADLPQARLFFGSAAHLPSDHVEATLLVLTMAGIVLPDASVPREQWSTAERLAVPLLHLATFYTTRRIYSRTMHTRKFVGLDEVGQMGAWASGRALFTRLGRDTRKWNTAAYVSSQNPDDILGLKVANFISTAYVGRIEDGDIATEALRLLNVPTGVGYENVLAGLSPRSGDKRRGSREFVVRDVSLNVDKVRIDMEHNPKLLAALDTTANPMKLDEVMVG